MEIKGKKALVLGGAGLVGQAICRKLIEKGVGEIIISSLFEREAGEFADTLNREFGKNCPKLHVEWGNVFVRQKFKDLSRSELLENPANREQLINDLLQPFNREILTASSMFHLCDKYKPQIVIDSINTATAISYQNLFGAAKETYSMLKKVRSEQKFSDESVAAVEKLLITQYLPQLIRHVQIFLSSMVEAKTECYLKIGTCGTGGMGLNIPYTHSEDKPSQMLLAKSSIAGAQSLLLFLMGRTPGGPIIKELKPAAAIAWKRIACDAIVKQGRPIFLEDVSFEDAENIGDSISKRPAKKTAYIEEGGRPKPLIAPFIDTGENGVFSLGEFETITDEGQMEFITPEEIAQAAIWEISGRNTGFDIVAALDNSTMGPTYRAGYLRKQAIEELEAVVTKTGIDSVAFEILGPPRLSKILYEAYLLRCVFKTFDVVATKSPEDMSKTVSEFLEKDKGFLSRIISIGIPVLHASGKKIVRGSRMAIPPDMPGQTDAVFDVTAHAIEDWAHDGWVDLRPANMKLWRERLAAISKEILSLDPKDTSSHTAKSGHYWNSVNGKVLIEESKLASWILIHEDEGERMKA